MINRLKKTGIGKRFSERWENLSPEEKRKFVIMIAVGLIFIGLLGIFWGKSHNQKKEVAKANETVVKREEVDVDLLKKASQLETQKSIEELKQANEELKKKLEEMEKEKKEKEAEIAKEKERGEAKGAERKERAFPTVPPPPPPPPIFAQANMPPLPEGQIPEVKKEVQVLSGIEVVAYERKKAIKEGEVKKEEGKEEVSAKAEVKKKYYLPPSFMVATLLSGLDAPATAKGEGHPVPVLLRVNVPAVLPNKVRANLRGCFVIAEGLGNLASERADLRLVSLSCIDRKGRAVIDQKVKGFVVDTDGKIGLRGRVVSKMGGVLARALLSGFISGFGNIIASQAQSISVSPSGTLSTIEPGKAVQYGIGTGIQSAANELLRFYMDLARQSIPVVEVLPTRSVTLVISEGVDLALKNVDF